VGLESPIAYESLTEDIVQGWISAIKSDVQIKVEANINGGDDTPIEVMPWD
jgi:DNA-binding CsgD family transcriptional regulator